MFMKIALVLAAVVVALVIAVSTRPDTYHVERAATFSAPPELAFALVNDFHKWQGWSPWEKHDLNMKKLYEGPAAGVGASYFWSGNDKVGEGRMTITDVTPGERIVIKLEFMKPWKSTNTATFAFARQGAGTSQVTWSMDGQNNFASKAFSFFMKMDSMIGPDFERGLANMRVLAEAEAQRLAAAAAPPPAPAAAAAPPIAPSAAPPAAAPAFAK